MSKYEKKIMTVVESFFNSHVLAEDGSLKVINEAEQKKANSAINKLVMEKIKDRWEKLEEADDSLSSIRDEIDFSELNAGDDSTGDIRIPHAGDEENEEEVSDEMPTFEAFDFNNIFEDGEDEDMVDGDEEFSDLQTGMDDGDMGGDELHTDPEINDFGDELDGDDDLGDVDGDSEEGFGELEFDFDFDIDGELESDEVEDEDFEVSDDSEDSDFVSDFDSDDEDEVEIENGDDDFEDFESEDEDK